jgi:hypothetical protein
MQVAAPAAGVFIAAAQQRRAASSFFFRIIMMRAKLPALADFAIAKLWQHFLEILYRCVRIPAWFSFIIGRVHIH